MAVVIFAGIACCGEPQAIAAEAAPTLLITTVGAASAAIVEQRLRFYGTAMGRTGIIENLPLYPYQFSSAIRIMQFQNSLKKVFSVTLKFIWQKFPLIFGIAAVLGACATGPQITRTQEVSESADSPYQKVLVITLLSSFDSRRYLEDEVVKQLSELGTDAVASTSMMNTKTPVTRETFLAMVQEIDADAVLVTQLVSLESKGKMKDMNPQATRNFRPTYYYNVWSVELEEYVEPQAAEFKHSLVVATQLYSALSREVVWAIESKSRIAQGFDQQANYSVFVDEAKAIATHLSKDGLIAK